MTGAEYLRLRPGMVIRFRAHLRVVIFGGPIGVGLRKLLPGLYPKRTVTSYTPSEIRAATLTKATAKLTRAERAEADHHTRRLRENPGRRARLKAEAWRMDNPRANYRGRPTMWEF